MKHLLTASSFTQRSEIGHLPKLHSRKDSIIGGPEFGTRERRIIIASKAVMD